MRLLVEDFVDDVGAPDPGSVQDFAALAVQLRRQRIWSGYPSLRQITAVAGTAAGIPNCLPKSTIHELLQGRRQPKEAVLRHLLAGLGITGDHTGPWIEAWRRAMLNSGTVSPAQPTRSGGGRAPRTGTSRWP